MRNKDLYSQILGLSHPWQVMDVDIDNDKLEVIVHVEAVGGSFACPKCQKMSSGYDHNTRRWRHLDTCQYYTILEAKIPRIECPEHGVLQVQVPWAESGSRFTALFETLAIDWLKEANILAVSRRLALTWDELDGIMQRAVRRGLACREKSQLDHIGVDETSFQKRHEYVTVVTDTTNGKVLHVADEHSQESLNSFFEGLSKEDLEGIKTVSMDMWKPYINSVKEYVPDADSKIAFDKFHVAKHLGDAVDKVRRQEHKALKAIGDETLKNTKYIWLQNPENMSESYGDRLQELKDLSLKTARAWAIKEFAMCLWSYVKPGWARKGWKRWLAWALRCQLAPMRKAACTIRDHLEGIVNAIVNNVTNACSESINAKIQRVKRMACGFRNRDRFRNAIYFHLGGLNLYPQAAKLTHSIS